MADARNIPFRISLRFLLYILVECNAIAFNLDYQFLCQCIKPLS